jgi:hypothetical protein
MFFRNKLKSVTEEEEVATAITKSRAEAIPHLPEILPSVQGAPCSHQLRDGSKGLQNPSLIQPTIHYLFLHIFPSSPTVSPSPAPTP